MDEQKYNALKADILWRLKKESPNGDPELEDWSSEAIEALAYYFYYNEIWPKWEGELNMYFLYDMMKFVQNRT